MERRSDLRAKTSLGAHILSPAGTPGTGCLVRNLSPAGAELVAIDAVPVPDRFDLKLPGTDAPHPARTVWRDGHRTGIAFLDRRATPPVLDDATAEP
jgi:hypothetical protein